MTYSCHINTRACIRAGKEEAKGMGTYKDSEVLSYTQGQVCPSCEQQFGILGEFILFNQPPLLLIQSFYCSAQSMGQTEQLLC